MWLGRWSVLTACTWLMLAGGVDSPSGISRRGSTTSIMAAGQECAGDLRSWISALIDDHDAAPGTIATAERTELRELYPADRRPLWLDAEGRPTANLRDAVMVLNQAANDGLDPAAYNQPVVAGLIDRLETTSSRDLAHLEVALSAGMLRYLRHVHIGRIDPRTIGFRLDASGDRHDFAVMLRDAITGQRVTELAADLRPPFAQYRLLRAMLTRYRTLATDPAIVVPPPPEKTVHPGEPYQGADVLRRQLLAFADLPATGSERPESGRYQEDLVEGVKHFQRRHGLTIDGLLGKSTIAALRVPLAWRVRQIELALERLRWLPRFGAERLVALNVPMFRLWAWDSTAPTGVPIFGMDAIVGRALSRQTPVFVGEMREVIFRPYWNVPTSILRQEVLPKLEGDPDYLRREEMEIVRGQGDDAPRVEFTADALAGLRQGTLRVRQRPGPKNALGLIKFVFPNQEDVYMHGTPAQALFAARRRDFSHGCVRVADPVTLAEWVLQDRPEWTRQDIVAATTGAQTIHVKLPRPIRVILFYTTAAVMPEDGTIHFADDIYQHDVKLERALTTRQTAR